MAHEDVERGVLAERVAEFLCVQLRALRHWPAASLTTVPPGEAAELRQWAHGLLRLVDEIKAERPPTAYEVARYEHQKALFLTHGRVRCQGRVHGHELGVWRPDEDRPGYELARCERCGAGASIHVGQVAESVSDALRETCPAPRRQTGDLR